MTTEKSADDELLTDVFSSGRDRGGKAAPSVPDDPAPPKAEPEPVAAKDEPKADTEQDADKPKGYRDPQSGRFVPLTELQSEREKRQEAQKAREEEARLRQEAEQRLTNYQQQIDDLKRQMTAAQQPRQQQQPQPPPDPYTDPEGALNHVANEFQRQLVNQRLNFSERMARRHYGEDVVNAAIQAAQNAGTIGHFVNTADPYDDLVSWHKRKQTMDRVGADPDAYEKRIRDEERQKVLDELRAGGQQHAAPANGHQQHQQPRFPTGLSDVPSAGPNVAQPVTDEAMMGGIFNTNRRRRG